MVRVLLSRKLGELRLTQADIARMTGIRPGTLSDYYWEEATGMKFEHMDKLCEVLHCSLSELIEVTPNDPPVLQGVETPKHRSKRGLKRHG